MKLMFVMLAMVACASGLDARPPAIVIPRSAGVTPAIPRINPVIPRSVTVANPVVHNVSPVRPLSPLAPSTMHLQPLSSAQSSAINSAVGIRNYNMYQNYERNFGQNQPVLNQSAHIAGLQGVIQSGTQPVTVQPGAGLGYNNSTSVREAQTALKQLGFYHGRVDGLFGSETQTALQGYQRSSSQPATGLLDRRTLSQLGVQNKNLSSN